MRNGLDGRYASTDLYMVYSGAGVGGNAELYEVVYTGSGWVANVT